MSQMLPEGGGKYIIIFTISFMSIFVFIVFFFLLNELLFKYSPYFLAC